MRPIPFAPVIEKLSLSAVNYGSVRRFFIGTHKDCAIPVALQENMINTSPPEQVFWLKGSDYAPFFPSESQTMKLKYSKETIMERTHYTLSKKV